MGVRGNRSALSAFAAAVLVLAQVAGCGSCVKDEPHPTSTATGTERKPINLKAADKKFTHYGAVDDAGEAGAATP
jgi:hypothetical protein